MKIINVKYDGFETEQCVDENLYDAIYQKGIENGIEKLFLAIDQQLPYDVCNGREAMNEICKIVNGLKEDKKNERSM